jgi:hypothetical protein
MLLRPVLGLWKENCGENVKDYHREGMGEMFGFLL